MGLFDEGGLFGPNFDPANAAREAQAQAPATVAPIANQGREDIPKATDLAETASGGARAAGQAAAGASGLSGAAGANAGAQMGGQAYSSTLAQVAPELSEQNVQQRGQDINKNIAQGEQDVTQRGQTVDYATNLAGQGQEAAKANSDQAGQWLQAGSGIAAAALASDERCKTGIEDDDGLLESLAKSVRGHKFRYKDSPGHEEVGVMAQDLEKTPLKSTVSEGPDGMKQIDTRRLSAANTAMISDLSRKLDKALSYMGRLQ